MFSVSLRLSRFCMFMNPPPPAPPNLCPISSWMEYQPKLNEKYITLFTLSVHATSLFLQLEEALPVWDFKKRKIFLNRKINDQYQKIIKTKAISL